MSRSFSRAAVIVAALAVGALLPALPAAAAGYSPGDPGSWPSRQLAAQLTHSCAPAGSPATARAHAAAGIGGIALLGNGASAALGEQLAQVRAAAPDGIAPLLASDEEGGSVQRLRHVIHPLPSAKTMGTWTDSRIEQTAHDYGVRMAQLGVRMGLAPVADLGVPGYYIDQLGRAFSSDPQRVGAAVTAWSRGLQRAGVVPVLKHWPGHGQASDSHTTAPVVPPLSTLEGRDMVPFEAAFAAGAPAVMVGHLQSPGLTEPGVPATLSPQALGYLRAEAGPDTVLVTDDLVMAASSRAVGLSPQTAAVRALQAGADWAMTCTPDPMPTVTAITQAIDDGSLPRARAVDSARRILALKDAAGLLATPLVTAAPVGTLDDVRTSGAWVRALGWALDPDTPAPSAVHVHVGGELVAVAGADAARPDVGQAFPGHGPGHGFDVAVRLPEGVHEVCVLALNSGAGAHTPLDCRIVTTTAEFPAPLPAACDGSAPGGFADVPASAWYAPSLACAVDHQLVRGTSAQLYAPEQTVTRAQAAAFLHRLLLRTDHPPAGSVQDAFADDDGSVHEDAVDALAALDVVQGTSPGRFEPDAPVTRAQLAALLVRLQETVAGPMPAGLTDFEDLAGSVHAVAVGKAAAASLTTGTTPWTFAPGQPVRRDATAAFLTRGLGSLERAGVLRR